MDLVSIPLLWLAESLALELEATQVSILAHPRPKVLEAWPLARFRLVEAIQPSIVVKVLSLGHSQSLLLWEPRPLLPRLVMVSDPLSAPL